jgi:hypothetical protein
VTDNKTPRLTDENRGNFLYPINHRQGEGVNMEQQGTQPQEKQNLEGKDVQFQALFSNWFKEFTGFFVIKPETLEDAGVQLEQAPEKEQV